MQRYSFVTLWVPGKQNMDADALSRAPVDQASAGDELGEGLPSFSTKIALLSLTGLDVPTEDASIDPVLEKIKRAAAANPVMRKLRRTFSHRRVRRHDCLRTQSCDPAIGSRLHLTNLVQMHQGTTKTRQRARMSVYWPNIGNDIINATKNCEVCTKHLPSLPPEPFKSRPTPTRPFEQIHADLGEINGRHFLVLVDSFSVCPHVVAFRDKSTTAQQVVEHTRIFFLNAGAPLTFWSDNGPQFGAAEFRSFLADWGITALTSSSHYAQSNGRAESEINTMKSLIHGSWTSGAFNAAKFDKSILLFRNAPRSGGASPANLIFNRPVRDCLPAHRRSFAPE
ncbi:Uncharacterized protein APZ42_018266 [Daphnia magna]|uniref:RNA-directed DNA polymerase n=1 Tax=Daphnia magna TaxID=35525 RepID=A0A164Z7V9_9CRUS|nr:Uncharacterized protein APZ42_018266 [Daphnia magna]